MRAAAIVVRTATAADVPSWLLLAAEVEPLFGPMVSDASFLAALQRNIERGSAFCVRAGDGSAGTVLRGGLLWSAHPPSYEIGWLAVARADRRTGVGRALVGHVLARVLPRSTVTVTTFAAGLAGGESALRFYAQLGFANSPVQVTSPDRQELTWRSGMHA